MEIKTEASKAKLESLLKSPATKLEVLSTTHIPNADTSIGVNNALNTELNNIDIPTIPTEKESDHRANKNKQKVVNPKPLEKEVHAPMLTSEALLIERIVLSINTFKTVYKTDPLGLVLSKNYEPTLKNVRSMFIKSDEPITEIMGLKIQYTVAPDMVLCL